MGGGRVGGLVLLLIIAIVACAGILSHGRSGGGEGAGKIELLAKAQAAGKAAIHAAALAKVNLLASKKVKLAEEEPKEVGIVGNGDKNLAVAGAVKDVTGDASPEGGDLKVDGTAPDGEDAIEKIQEEVKAAADEEIDTAVSQAKADAEEAYKASRDSFMKKEAAGAGHFAPNDEIYPPEGTPGRPAGYARQLPSSVARPVVALPRGAVPRAAIGTALPGAQYKDEDKGQELSQTPPSHGTPEGGRLPFSGERKVASKARTGKGSEAAAVAGRMQQLALAASRVPTELGGGDADPVDDLFKAAVKDLVAKISASAAAPVWTPSQPRKARPPPSPSSSSSSSSSWSRDAFTGFASTGEVPTECGNVKGVSVGQGVNAFLGIRYALPPARWTPSKPAKDMVDGVPLAGCWSGVLTAASFGAVCPQALGPWSGEDESEDCLFLNVYAPDEAGRGGGGRLPVVVFVHGGGDSGAGSRYDLTSLAGRGFVAVSLNYRLGSLGWLAAGAGPKGNYGLGDVALALRWVQGNIQAFGGDPRRVTLAGQGSGGTIALALAVSPLGRDADRPLFARVLALSPPPKFGAPLADAVATAGRFARAAGCVEEEPLECLQGLKLGELSRTWGAVGAAGAREDYGLPVRGQTGMSVITVDGDAVPKESWKAFGDPAVQSDVSVMMTFMTHEGDGGGAPSDWDALTSLVDREVGSFGDFWEASRGSVPFASETLRLYAAAARRSPAAAYADMVTDSRFTCAGKRLAGLAASARGDAVVYLGINTMTLSDRGVALERLSSDGLAYATPRGLFGAVAPGSGQSFTGLDLMMYLRDERRYQFVGPDATTADRLGEILDHYVRTGTTEGAGYGTIQDVRAYLWKPVSDGAAWGGEDAIGYPSGVAVGVLGQGGVVQMEDRYHEDKCGLFARDAMDRDYAAV